jgi:hypothetical protein
MPALNQHATTRGEPGAHRRGALIALAGAALASISTVSTARAGKRSGKSRNRARERAEKRCGQQGDACRAAYSDMCDARPIASCLELRDAIQACCVHLENCQAGDTFTCILDISANINERRLGFRPR